MKVIYVFLLQMVLNFTTLASQASSSSSHQDDDPDHILNVLNPLVPMTLEKFKDSLQTSGKSPTLNMLLKAIVKNHYQLITFMLKRLPDDCLTDDASRNKLLEHLLLVEDPLINELVFARFPNMLAFENMQYFESFVIRGISKGIDSFVIFLLKDVKSIRSDLFDILLQLSLDTHNLPLIERLSQLEGSSLPYPAILKLNNLSDEDLEKKVMGYAMHSPLSMIYDLALYHDPRIQEFLAPMLKKLSLLVRFPNAGLRFQPVELGNTEEYIDKSIEYAKENSRLLDQISERGRELLRDRGELRDFIVEDRYKRLNVPNANRFLIQKYRTQCTDQKMRTQILGLTSSLDCLGVKVEGKRYAYAIRHFFAITYNLDLQKKIEKHYSARITDSSVEFYYKSSQTNKPIEITKMTCEKTSLGLGLNWYHNIYCNFLYSGDQKSRDSYSERLEELYKEWNELHKQILDYDLRTQDRQTFFRLVAKAYWLNATMCEMLRGTPHSAMIWLNLVYAFHKLPPPVPKLEYFFLDNLMLMIPVEYAMDHWLDFFEVSWEEYVIEQALKVPNPSFVDSLKRLGASIDSERESQKLAPLLFFASIMCLRIMQTPN